MVGANQSPVFGEAGRSQVSATWITTLDVAPTRSCDPETVTYPCCLFYLLKPTGSNVFTVSFIDCDAEKLEMWKGFEIIDITWIRRVGICLAGIASVGGVLQREVSSSWAFPVFFHGWLKKFNWFWSILPISCHLFISVCSWESDLSPADHRGCLNNLAK